MPAVIINGKVVNFEIEEGSILVDGRRIEFAILREGKGKLLAKIGSSVEEIAFSENGGGTQVYSGKSTLTFEVLSDRELLLRSLAPDNSRRGVHSDIKAPMPGLVVKTLVKKGEAVTKGTSLVILEAMKMENEIRTPVDAEVAEVFVHDGDIVEKDQTIIRLA